MKTPIQNPVILHPKLAQVQSTAPVRQSDQKRHSVPAPSEYLVTKEAAAFLNVSKSFLDKLRVAGGGPEFIRLGARKVLYRRQDLETWARSRRFESTSQYPGTK